jgi:hypothetical protein
VTPAGLLDLLIEFYRDTLGLLLRHQEGARCVGQYGLNNVYQHVIAREDVHLQWIAAAIAAAGGVLPDAGGVPPVPAPGKGAALMQEVLRDDAERHRAFVGRWRTRVGTMTQARDRKMLDLILGEMLEQLRFFEQGLGGRTDLLGRHAPGAGERGEVLAARWLE